MARKKQTEVVDETPDAPPVDDVDDAEDEAPAAPAPKAKSKFGRFLVVVRHSISPLKKLVVDALDEADAWAKFMEAVAAKLGDDNDGKKTLDLFMASPGQRTITRQ